MYIKVIFTYILLKMQCILNWVIKRGAMNKYTYISLFSSAGVGCYGFKSEGFECVATNELLEKRMQIQKYNHKCKFNSGYIVGDITLDETKKAIFSQIELWKKQEKIKELDVLIATPPCQGMSVANHKKKDELSRNSLIVESIIITNQIKPKYFIYENVRAFLKTVCRIPSGKDILIGQFIDDILAGSYNILKRVVNFKDYGSNSSRTRTLVIGVRKDIQFCTPFDIFPQKSTEKILKDVIGDLPSLSKMGEISKQDIYHSFRKYDKKMLPWISHTPEGHSAFDNREDKYKPHKIVDGKIVVNTNKNGDKYTRCFWNKVAPCIHTRNDILASQSTIHPSDNRVFSIRELMRMMTIPDSFCWSDIPISKLNRLPQKDKEAFIKQEDIRIRQSIGEAVPTIIFQKIAKQIKYYETCAKEISNVKKFVLSQNWKNIDDIKDFLIKSNFDLDYGLISSAIEYLNTNKKDCSAYYTPKNICYNVVKELPDLEKDNILILEPSVGAGNFIPLILEKYTDKNIEIDVIDIDQKILEVTTILLSKISHSYHNVKINIINEDYLTFQPTKKYDIIVGNPPFGKVSDSQKLELYKTASYNKNTNNLFAFFLEKSLKTADFVSLITPKSLLSSPEYNDTRKYIAQKFKIKSILDFGEKGFSGVKIETIAISICTTSTVPTYDIKVESLITNKVHHISNNMMIDEDLSSWLIYKNNFFEQVKETLYLGIFCSYRDRQITKKNTSIVGGKYRVLKSRNIVSNNIININNYDTYIDDISSYSVSKFLNTKSVVVPNLTYNPRACFLPKNCITDGSVAILQAKNGYSITEADLAYFASDEFKQFYMIGRNLGSRSLNIDSNSVKLWGIKKERHRYGYK